MNLLRKLTPTHVFKYAITWATVAIHNGWIILAMIDDRKQQIFIHTSLETAHRYVISSKHIKRSQDHFPQSALDPSGDWMAKLELYEDHFADNAWFVDWVRISTEEFEYNCPMEAWLQRGSNSSITTSCQLINVRVQRQAKV